MELHGVLAGVAMRTTGINRHTLIDGTALLILQGAKHQPSVGSFPKRRTAIAGEDLACNLGAAVTGKAQNADGTDLVAGGYGSNHVRHINKLPLFQHFAVYKT